jgi:hypothetical protein
MKGRLTHYGKFPLRDSGFHRTDALCHGIGTKDRVSLSPKPRQHQDLGRWAVDVIAFRPASRRDGAGPGMWNICFHGAPISIEAG